MGITRLNAYAGMAAGYLITDTVTVGASPTGDAPAIPALAYTIPLILQDKSFKAGRQVGQARRSVVSVSLRARRRGRPLGCRHAI